MGYEVETIDGLRASVRRAVVFLTSNTDAELNAAKTFAALPKQIQRKVLDRMDHWIDGGIRDDYFHGWKDPSYRECFTFKWNYKREHHRFYGFLCHPLMRTDMRFLLCVLVSHAVKNDWNTDPDELTRANRLRVNPYVRAAITMEFPDESLPCRLN